MLTSEMCTENALKLLQIERKVRDFVVTCSRSARPRSLRELNCDGPRPLPACPMGHPANFEANTIIIRNFTSVSFQLNTTPPTNPESNLHHLATSVPPNRSGLQSLPLALAISGILSRSNCSDSSLHLGVFPYLSVFVLLLYLLC
jgi:hypothetical protein